MVNSSLWGGLSSTQVLLRPSVCCSMLHDLREERMKQPSATPKPLN